MSTLENPIRVARRTDLLAMSQDQLDELVYEHHSYLASLEMNETDNEEEQESILSSYESAAGCVNDQGSEDQIQWILDFEYPEEQ